MEDIFFLYTELPDHKNNTASCIWARTNQHSTGPLAAAGMKLAQWPEQLIVKGSSNQRMNMGLPGCRGFIKNQFTLVSSSHSSGRILDTRENWENKTKYGISTIASLCRKIIGWKIKSALDQPKQFYEKASRYGLPPLSTDSSTGGNQQCGDLTDIKFSPLITQMIEGPREVV